jgi:hypothetical protein
MDNGNLCGLIEEFESNPEIDRLYSKLGYSYVERKCTKLLEKIEVIIKHELSVIDKTFFFSAYDSEIFDALLINFDNDDLDKIREKVFDELNDMIKYHLTPQDHVRNPPSLNEEKQPILQETIISEISENLSQMLTNIKDSGLYRIGFTSITQNQKRFQLHLEKRGTRIV